MSIIICGPYSEPPLIAVPYSVGGWFSERMSTVKLPISKPSISAHDTFHR